MNLAHSATAHWSYGNDFWTTSPVPGTNAAAATDRARTSGPMLVRYAMAGIPHEYGMSVTTTEA